MKETIINKVSDKSLKCGVIGLGYVGLPLLTQIAKKGFSGYGFDVSESKVNDVNRGENYISDIDNSVFKDLVNDNKIQATTDFSKLKEMDFIAICVPTPLDEHQMPDLSYIESSAEQCGLYITKGTAICLESTTYPGTTEEILRPIIEAKSGLKCDDDFFLGFSPERIDPGNKDFKTNNTPKVLGGTSSDSTEVLKSIYENILDAPIYSVSSPKIAEMEKILENTFRNINIGLVNEMAIVCEKLGINIWEVIDAAKTKPYGFTAFYPGPGLGGHCIPLDPAYLSWKAKEFDYHIQLIESSAIINDNQPSYVVERIMKNLNKSKKSLNGSKILVLGVAYKQDIDDYRESPALEIIKKLQGFGAEVKFYDSYINEYTYEGKVNTGYSELTKETVADADLTLIITAHTNVDYDLVQQNSKSIFDTRNVYKNAKFDNLEVL
jgi:UDP-N-acetyl-D-glucosamine dehydrogenase